MRLWRDDEIMENTTNTLAIAKVVPQHNEEPISYLSTDLLGDMLELADVLGWDRVAVWQTMKDYEGESPLTFAPKGADFGVAIAPVIYDD